MAKLVVITEEMKDRTFELTDDKVCVGRLLDNQVRLEDNTVSNHHAELIRKGEDYVVRDLNSTNGTRVNGQRVVETRLYHGDTITFGHLQLQYFSSFKNGLPPIPSSHKKTIDLSKIPIHTTVRATTRPPHSYGSTSPFAKQKRNRSKTVLQITVLGLGIIAILLLVHFINKLLNL